MNKAHKKIHCHYNIKFVEAEDYFCRRTLFIIGVIDKVRDY